LNVDAGELANEPEALARLAHVLHVACGGHAGDELTMRATVRRARASGARVGAHPSYPDRDGFGRRPMALPLLDLAQSVRDQVAAIAAIAAEEGVVLVSLKPHGALYHAANADPALAASLVSIASSAPGAPLAVVGPPAGELRRAAESARVPFLREGFADRAYERDGTLRDRAKPDALIADPAAALAQARTLAPHVDTLCVHGDAPDAVAILEALREAFP
jgi:UPF0271 protein